MPEVVCLCDHVFWVGLSGPARKRVEGAEQIDTHCRFQKPDGSLVSLYHYRMPDGLVIEERIHKVRIISGGCIVFLKLTDEAGVEVEGTSWPPDACEEIINMITWQKGRTDLPKDMRSR